MTAPIESYDIECAAICTDKIQLRRDHGSRHYSIVTYESDARASVDLDEARTRELFNKLGVWLNTPWRTEG